MFLTERIKMFWDYCYRWIDNHNAVLNTLLALAGVVATIAIAKRVFSDGLRVDRDKVLDEFALELVTEFILPFQDLKSAFKPIQDGLGNTVEDSDVNLNSMLTVIQGSMFQAKFPYYESHKGDIWDSLQKNNKDKLIQRF